MKDKLDFICIGAAKSATSTLFELIKNHPQIYIPPEKEVPFFNDDKLFDNGWDWYMKTFFSKVKVGVKAGTITPQYMSGNGTITPRVISKRIVAQMPNIKVIAILRHPVERSYSHFRMHKRQNLINDASFEEAVTRLIDNSNLELEHRNRNLQNAFLFGSEYGDILSSYYKMLPKRNVLVLYTDNLKKDPRSVLKSVFEFLEVDEAYEPPNLKLQMNKGGTKAKIKYLSPAYIRKSPIIEFIWQHLVPIRLRKKIYYKILVWNTKTDDSVVDPNSQTFMKLVKYFSKDIEKLEKETGESVPWRTWRKY